MVNGDVQNMDAQSLWAWECPACVGFGVASPFAEVVEARAKKHVATKKHIQAAKSATVKERHAEE